MADFTSWFGATPGPRGDGTLDDSRKIDQQIYNNVIPHSLDWGTHVRYGRQRLNETLGRFTAQFGVDPTGLKPEQFTPQMHEFLQREVIGPNLLREADNGPGYVAPEAVAAGAKPAIPQQDGSISTEKTISFEADGKHYVIPTIIGGKSYTPDAAIDEFVAGRNKALGVFGSQQEATDFAEQRSRNLDSAFGGGGVLRKGPSAPAAGGLIGGGRR